MTVPAKNDKAKTENVVEIKGKKFTVTPEFKQAIEEHTTELTTKVKTSETQVQTLSQRIAELDKKPPKNVQVDPDDDDSGESITFDALIDKPQEVINRAVAKALKKAGQHGGVVDADALEKKIELKQMQQKYWDDFEREHPYFDMSEHDFIIKGVAQKLMPTIKDLSLKDGRKKIAEATASILGRAIKGGKLEVSTESKHKVQNGMQLESADGGTVDNDTDGDNTVAERTGSMADLVRNSPRSPYAKKKVAQK